MRVTLRNMNDTTDIQSSVIEPKRRSRLADFSVRLVREKPLGTIGGIIILMLIFVGIFADVLMPYPYDKLNLVDRLQGASARHLLGTDQLGRDLLSRIIYGARISILVGLAATGVNVVVAVLIGGASGFLGGKLDLAVQRFVDAWMALPGLLLLLTIMSIAGRGVLQIILVLGIAGGVVGSRVVRGAVIGIKENDYFLAARAIGSPTTATLMRHVLPNIMPVVVIIFSITIGGVILSLASLSFLGYGLPLGVPDWGRYAQLRRTSVHGASAMAGSLARSCPDNCHLQSKHVRRRHAGPPRPQAQGHGVSSGPRRGVHPAY